MPRLLWMLNLNATRGGIKSVDDVTFKRSEAAKHVKLFFAPKDGTQGLSDSMVPDYLVSEGMIDRFLEIDPPVFRVIAEYDAIFEEIESTYVKGMFFSSLSAAVVTIERILNTTRMELHPHVSPKFKQLWPKGPTNEWQPNIDALRTWGYLSDKLAKELEELYAVRCNYLHSGSLASLQMDAQRAVHAAYDLSKEIMGFPPKLFSMANGGINCLDWNDPLVQIFYKPHVLVQED
jgi:hypothetical protein